MKRWLLLLFVFVFNTTNAQPSLETQLRHFPIVDYLHKPIDSLLAHLPSGFDTAFEISDNGNLYTGATLWINYLNENFSVDISITDAHYITVHKDSLQTPPEVAWSLSLLRKEKIGSITIYKFPLKIINSRDIY